MSGAARNAGAKPAASTHALPPVSHEIMRGLVPGLDTTIKDLAKVVRGRPSWDDTSTISPPELQDLDAFQHLLNCHASALLDQGYDEDSAAEDANYLGHHCFCYVNFELHRRKVFWVDGSLAWMLMQTRLDIEGRLLRPPFPCFGIVFTDRASLDLAEAMMNRDVNAPRGVTARIVSVYVTRTPSPADTLGINVAIMVDHTPGKWPYMLARELLVRPDDDLEAILDSRFPDLPRAAGVDIFRTSEVKRLVHLVINAILYATSGTDRWPVLVSPVTALKRSTRDLGDRRRRRAHTRAREMLRDRSGEDVFYLPGKIPLSQVRQLHGLGKTSDGAEILARFMVRGHWRRASADWKDKRLRWIEPYWKGPEMAAIIERQYRMKV